MSDDRRIAPEDRLAFAAFAGMSTIPRSAVALHWKMSAPQDKDRWRRAAAAVLAEMREPTEAMLDAGMRERQDNGGGVTEVWGAMVEAANAG